MYTYIDFAFCIFFFLVTTKLNSASNRQNPAESNPTPSPASPPEDNTNKQPTTTYVIIKNNALYPFSHE
jgi:hypothetical protein